jgi:hypothetical protein
VSAINEETGQRNEAHEDNSRMSESRPYSRSLAFVVVYASTVSY